MPNRDDFLTPCQTETLRAAVNRIIPADDYPGGWDAGVGSFFALLFAREPRFLPAYRSGLDSLERGAQKAIGASFADLATEQQDALLTRIEAGDTQGDWSQEAAAFFGLLIEQTMEGFYADPGNGGNKNGIAWDMIGYRITA